MQTTESAELIAPPSVVFPHVADLAAYPAWLPMVHEATLRPADDDGRPAWNVEIRARVGPFARSKRLLMRRTELVSDRLVVFERDELDGRDHAGWTLRVELDEASGGGTTVTMHLAYDGSLWTGALLGGVLDDQVRRGRTGLAALVDGSPND